MKVSVVTCTRNRPNLVDRVVRSVLANTYPKFEYLIIDQSDSGLTARAVRGASGGDSRIRHFRHSGRGKSRALNFAAHEATGDVVAVIDDDCEARPDWIAALVAELENAERTLSAAGSSRCPTIQPKGMWSASSRGSLRCSSRTGAAFTTWAGATTWRSCTVLRRVGPFDEMLGPGAPSPRAKTVTFSIGLCASGVR